MLDLTELFGEGWCVTLAPGEPGLVLERMGATGATELPDGLERATGRLVRGADNGVLLLGREVAADWTLALELEGTTGWVGISPRALASLSQAGRTALSACADPNQLTVHVAVDGMVVGWVDADTGRRHGKDFGPVGQSLSAAGFPAPGADELSGEAAAMTPDERVVLALRQATGVQLEEDHFEGSWLGGITIGV